MERRGAFVAARGDRLLPGGARSDLVFPLRLK
jgi:hypothetical protein